MIYVILAVALAGALFTAHMQNLEETAAETADEDFDHNEGEETHDEDL